MINNPRSENFSRISLNMSYWRLSKLHDSRTFRQSKAFKGQVHYSFLEKSHCQPIQLVTKLNRSWKSPATFHKIHGISQSQRGHGRKIPRKGFNVDGFHVLYPWKGFLFLPWITWQHPRKLTCWTQRHRDYIEVWKMIFLFNCAIFSFQPLNF